MPIKGPKCSLLCLLYPVVSQVNLVQILTTQVFQMCLVASSHIFLGVKVFCSCQVVTKIFHLFFSFVAAAYPTHLFLHTFMIHISFIDSFVISFIPNFTNLAPVSHQ
jgi:hypothetical protein